MRRGNVKKRAEKVEKRRKYLEKLKKQIGVKEIFKGKGRKFI